VAAEQEQHQTEVTPLVAAAIAMHEMFLSLVAGGFERDDALTLVAKMTAEAKTDEE
jgi:hypothetical protein